MSACLAEQQQQLEAEHAGGETTASAAKRARRGSGEGEEQEALLARFRPQRALKHDSRSKSACVLGTVHGSPHAALVLLEKKAFTEQQLTLGDAYFSGTCELSIGFQNDAYTHAECFPPKEHNGVKVTVIHPATEKHIQKYSRQECHIVLETAQLYREVTLPHIEREQFNLQWVFNILEGTSEQERIVHEDKCERDGFVLLPDLKWDGRTQETLYLLAVVRRRGIKSLRDLDGTHLPLLKRIRDEGKKAILDKYQLGSDQLRIYLHYQPSFYHLHVHFTYLRHEAPGIHCEKAHLLDTVINNIEMLPNYYKAAALSFTIREMDNLFRDYEAKGLVQRVKKDTNGVNEELIDK